MDTHGWGRARYSDLYHLQKTVNTYIEKQKEEVFYLNYKEEKVEMKKATLQAWAKIALKDGLINNETYIKMSREIEKIKA